jgi:hypothetical protein
LPPSAASTAYSAPALAATGGTGALTWSAMGLPAWLSLSSSGTLSGTPVATGTWNFIVKVTDSGTPAPQTASQSLSITINGASGGALAITTTTLASGVVGIPYTASVTVGGGASPYTWSIASGSLPAGLSLSTTTGAISGTPTTVATATTSNFTVTVTDSSSTPQTAGPQSLSITINPAAAACTSSGSESILSGQYAFSLSGYNGTGFLAVAGAFTADGTGKITAGEADTNGVLGVQTSAIDPSASSYSVGSDNRGCATIVTSFGTFTTRFALGNISGTTATKGRIIEFENPTSSAYIASGQILQQNAASFGSQFSGNYVFVQTGVDASSANARIGAAGVLSVSSGSITTGEMDVNEAGTPTHFTSVTGSMSSADTNGRFTMTTTWTGLPSTGNSFGYMVSSSQALLVNTNANQVLAGEVQAQTAPTGGFTNGTATGNVVVSASGANGGGSGISANVALFNANGAGSLTGTSYYDGGGTMQTHAITCTYMVATNGRIPLTGCGGGSGPVIYFFAANKGYFMSLDSDVLIGQVEPQTGAPFSVASASGNYYMGTLEVVNQNADAGVGAAALDGSGSVTTTNDFTSISSQETGNTDTSTITVNSDGTIINSNHPTVITGIVISSTKVVIMDNVNSTYPTVQVIKK